MHFSHISKIILLFSLLSKDIWAQEVTRNIIVEHFTNTRCGVCASRNPGFYNNLRQNPDIIHIAYHPSSPYSTCLFNTQNKLQNDARTKYYDVYGGTPQFVVNGTEISSSQVSNSEVYSPFKNKTSPIDLKVFVANALNGEIEVSFNAVAKKNNSIGKLNYFIALVEDTVFYNAPNGEKTHYDVFRKSFSDNMLPTFDVPQNEGGDFSFRGKIKIENIWNLSRIYAVVVLTDGNKKVLQVAKSDLYNANVLSGTSDEEKGNSILEVYPNPAESTLYVRSNSSEELLSYEIYNHLGQCLLKSISDPITSTIDVSILEHGMYYLRLHNDTNTFIYKFLKK